MRTQQKVMLGMAGVILFQMCGCIGAVMHQLELEEQIEDHRRKEEEHDCEYLRGFQGLSGSLAEARSRLNEVESENNRLRERVEEMRKAGLYGPADGQEPIAPSERPSPKPTKAKLHQQGDRVEVSDAVKGRYYFFSCRVRIYPRRLSGGSWSVGMLEEFQKNTVIGNHTTMFEIGGNRGVNDAGEPLIDIEYMHDGKLGYGWIEVDAVKGFPFTDAGSSLK